MKRNLLFLFVLCYNLLTAQCDFYRVVIDIGQSNAVSAQGLDNSLVSGFPENALIWNVDFTGGRYAECELTDYNVNTGGFNNPTAYSPAVIAANLKKGNVIIFKFAVGGSVLEPTANDRDWAKSEGELFARFESEWNLFVAALQEKCICFYVDEVVWTQGESDASNSIFNTNYAQDYLQFKQDINSVIGQSPTWILWQLSDKVTFYPAANIDMIRAQQVIAANSDAETLIYLNSLNIHTDLIHITNADLIVGALDIFNQFFKN